MLTCSFYARRSQKRKMTDDFTVIFALLVSLGIKTAHKMLIKLTLGVCLTKLQSGCPNTKQKHRLSHTHPPHTHTQTHTHKHTHTHTRTHTHTHTHKHAHTHTHIRTYAHTHAHTYTHYVRLTLLNTQKINSANNYVFPKMCLNLNINLKVLAISW